MSTARSRQKTEPRLIARRRRLLALLQALGGRARNLDFQKLLFLYGQEPDAEDLYEFVPYKFGAFSFTSYADRRKLVGRRLLIDDAQYWQLTDEGDRIAGKVQDPHMTDFARRHRDLRGDSLVAETYRRYPYYAARSEIAKRVLRGDDLALRRIEAARRTQKAPALFTIGYEGRTLEGYLNTLLRSGVTLLYDVRRNPISRKYGFSRSTLASGCEGVGIRYEHLPELGIVSGKRRDLATQADYDALFSDYETVTLPKQGEALAKIRQEIESGERVVLTCYERLPQQCHRHCVADVLERDDGKGLVAQHL